MVTLPGTGEYVLNQSITATWSATDALSGVVAPVSGTVSIDTSSVGTKTFTLPAGTAKDKAGNSSLKVTKSYSVIAATEEPVIEDPDTVYPQKWATGTGTASNPWAGDCLNDAYTACPNGGTIYLRAGYYQLAGAVGINKEINIIGEGMGKTFIVVADGCYGITVGEDHVTLKGFTIDGAAQTAGDFPLINASNCDYLIVEDIEAKNGITTGIQPFECNYSLFQNIYTHDNGYFGTHPTSWTTGRNCYNTWNYIYAYDNTKQGIDDGPQVLVHNNTYNNIHAWDNGGFGIALENQIGLVLSNSSTSGNGAWGMYLSGIKDSTISNCLVTLNSTFGIHLATGDFASFGGNNVNFTNVIVKNNNKTGIKLYDCADITFTSCQSYDDRDTPLQQYGLELNDNTNTGISLLNCKLSPNKDGEIYNPSGVAVLVITDKMLAKF